MTEYTYRSTTRTEPDGSLRVEIAVQTRSWSAAASGTISSEALRGGCPVSEVAGMLARGCYRENAAAPNNPVFGSARCS